MRIIWNGAWIIHKPEGLTSAAVVHRVSRALGKVKAGHCGTLDPFATGVLPVLVGRATRLQDFFLKKDKIYSGIIRFGWETDTQDGTGEPTSVPATPHCHIDDLKRWMAELTGTVLQTIPRYSAVKWQGKAFYAYARNQQEIPDRQREIRVQSFTLVAWEPPLLSFHVVCGSGTYVRALAQSLGEKAGCGAHLLTLVRLASGPFTLEQSVPLEELRPDDTFPRGWVDISSLPLAIPSLSLTWEQCQYVIHGRSVPWESHWHEAKDAEAVRLVSPTGLLLALGMRKCENSAETLAPFCVLIDADTWPTMIDH